MFSALSCYFLQLKLNKIYSINLTKISEITYAIYQRLSKLKLHKELLVFSVTPFKIDQNKNKNRSTDRVQNLRKKEERKYAKTLAKIQVTEIFPMEDMQRNFSPKFIEICMEMPCWPDTEFCYKSVNLFLEELKNVTIILFSHTRTVQIAKFPEISHSHFNQDDSSLGRHVNVTSCKSSEIQA